MRDAHTYTPHVNNLNYRLSRTEGLNIPTTIIVDSFKRIKNALKFVQTTVNNHTKILTFDDTRLSRLKLFPSIDFNVERKVLTLELIPTCSKRCSISWTKNSSSMSISEVFINGRNEIGISNAALRSVKILPGQISIRLMGNDDRINTPRGCHDHYGFCTALNRCNNRIINPQVQSLARSVSCVPTDGKIKREAEKGACIKRQGG